MSEYKLVPVAVVDADDDGMWADILPDVTVKVGQTLYAAPQPAEQQPDPFRGDNAALIRSAQSLLSLDDKGAFGPNGIGDHARNIITAFIARTSVEQQPAPDVAGLLGLLEYAQCTNCDGSGARYVSHGESEQCQWCYERAKALATHSKGGEV